MGKCFLHGNGGGAGLNFKVVRYASEADLPETAKENTVAFFSDVEMSGYVFDVVAPTEPIQGMVWFLTGESSTVAFNALKKNGVMVYPLSAKQYVDGAWVDVTAKSYQNGDWVDWCLYLINAEGVNTELLGGIYGVDEDGSTSNTSVTNTGDGINISTSGMRYKSIWSHRSIDVTNYSKMYIVTGSTSISKIGLSTSAGGFQVISNLPSSTAITINCGSNTTNIIDISGRTGAHYLAIYIATSGATNNYIKEIRLE